MQFTIGENYIFQLDKDTSNNLGQLPIAIRDIHFGTWDKYILEYETNTFWNARNIFCNTTQLLSHVNGFSIPYQLYLENFQVKSNTMITLFCLRTSSRQHDKSAFSSFCKSFIWWEQWNKYSQLPGFWALICSKYTSKCKEISDLFHDALFVILDKLANWTEE